MIQKLRDVRHEDIPDINNEKIRERVLEGDKDMNEVDNGGYNFISNLLSFIIIFHSTRIQAYGRMEDNEDI